MILRMTAALLGVLSASCSYYHEQRYPTFDEAVAVEPRVPDPPVIHAQEAPEDLIGLIPYIQLQGDFPPGSGQLDQARNFKSKILKSGLKPDVIIYNPGGSAYAGSVAQYWGWGVSTSTPVFRPQGYALCCRLSPVSMGWRMLWDTSMVVSVSDELRTECGIQEGDIVVSINEQSVRLGPHNIAPAMSELLRCRPGDKIRVVWIRQGEGKMECTCTAREGPGLPQSVECLVNRLEAKTRVKRHPLTGRIIEEGQP